MTNWNKENEYVSIYSGALRAVERLFLSTLVSVQRTKRDLEHIRNEIDKHIRTLESIIDDDGVTN